MKWLLAKKTHLIQLFPSPCLHLTSSQVSVTGRSKLPWTWMMVPKFLDLKGLASTFILCLLGKKSNIRAIGFEETYWFFFFFIIFWSKKKKKKEHQNNNSWWRRVTEQDYHLRKHHLQKLLSVLLQLYDYIRALIFHCLHMVIPEINPTQAQWTMQEISN